MKRPDEAPTVIGRLRHVLPGLLAAGVLFSASIAQAAPPNVTQYCQTHVHPGIPMSYREEGGRTPPTCIDPKSRATTAETKNQTPVDMAIACQLTNGSEDFRYVDGAKIDCSRNPRPLVTEGPGVEIVQPEYLTKYCADWFGSGSVGEYSAELKRTVCTSGSGSAPGPQTVNFALLCEMYYRTDKVRYVKADRYYIACLQ